MRDLLMFISPTVPPPPLLPPLPKHGMVLVGQSVSWLEVPDALLLCLLLIATRQQLLQTVFFTLPEVAAFAGVVRQRLGGYLCGKCSKVIE